MQRQSKFLPKGIFKPKNITSTSRFLSAILFETFQNIASGKVLFSADCLFEVSESPSKFAVDVRLNTYTFLMILSF